MLYTADLGTGTGDVLIGNDTTGNTDEGNPAVWSVAMPGGLSADAYVSTITTSIAASP